jgi:TonB family protein
MNASAYGFSDFNQTLVYSVFFHFLFLILLMYIPKPNPFDNREPIPLTVSLIPLPQSNPSQSSAPIPSVQIKEESANAKDGEELPQKTETKIIKPKEIAIEPIEVASLLPINNPIIERKKRVAKLPDPKSTGQKILAQLNQLTGESKEKTTDNSNSLVNELDQLAKLTPKLESQPKSNKKVWEQTFKDLEKIQKTKSVNDQQDFFTPPISEELDNSLKELVALDEKIINQELENNNSASETNHILSEIKKLRDEKIDSQLNLIKPLDVNQKIKELENVENINVEELTNQEESEHLEKLEFESFEKKSEEDGNGEKTYKDLLNDLDNLANLNPVPKLELTEASSKKPATSSINQPIETGSMLKSVERSIEVEPIKNVAIEISGISTNSEEFESKVKTFTSSFEQTTANLSPELTKDKLSEEEKVINGQSGDEYAQALSSYAGFIQDKIYSHWEVPLGVAIRKKIVVSFTLFRMGTIDKPRLVQSSGEEKLDALALKAIFDSEPFSPFPKEMRELNIVITINFKLEVQP